MHFATTIYIFILILQFSICFRIDGILPQIETVIKKSEGYTSAITLKFTYSPILTSLYNKIDIYKGKLEKSKNSPIDFKLARTIDANVKADYIIQIRDIPAGEVFLKVCGRSSYRSAKKCSKLYSFDNSVIKKHTSSANKHSQVHGLGFNSQLLLNSLTGRVFGYDLMLIWTISRHTISPQISLKIKLLADIDRTITFGNGNGLKLEAGTKFATIRLPYTYYKFGYIRVSLCFLIPSSDGDIDYMKKTCPLPLLISNNYKEHRRRSGVVDIKLDGGEARVRLLRPISLHNERVSVECGWFDTRIDLVDKDNILRQDVTRGDRNMWDVVINDLNLHSAYSCYIHIVGGDSYQLYSQTPFIFHT